MPPPRGQGDILRASVRLGRVAGIPLGLHYSWFIIAALITVSIAGQLGMEHPAWGGVLVWSTAVVTAVLFFVTLLAHELSHALVAITRGLPVRSITLFALGGLAQMEKDADSARTEFLVAIAGPVCSFAIGFGCIELAQGLGWSTRDDTSGVVGGVLGWLGSINIALAAFNLIPGYPLDGGRVLRAALWGWYGSMERATRAAARTGQAVAGVFIVLGLLQTFTGYGAGGLWLAVIGWFLFGAAQANYAHATISERLRNVRVGDIMVNDCVRVDADTPLYTLIDDPFLQARRRCVMVQRDGVVVGLVTPGDLVALGRAYPLDATASDVMRPLGSLNAVTPDTPATEAFTAMVRDNVTQLPVIVRGQLEGIVSRARILQRLRSH